MTNEQINLVKTSFARIEPLAEEAAVLFYAKLFDLDPDLRLLFKSDTREQGLKLMQMIGLAVAALDHIDKIVPAVQAMGARHVVYGVKNRHYESVGKALLWTFEKALKADFTAETKAAWTEVYNTLAQTMKEAACRKAETAIVV